MDRDREQLPTAAEHLTQAVTYFRDMGYRYEEAATLTALIVDPESQTGIPSTLRTSITDPSFTADRLVSAGRSFAPETVSVIKAQGMNERELG